MEDTGPGFVGFGFLLEDCQLPERRWGLPWMVRGERLWTYFVLSHGIPVLLGGIADNAGVCKRATVTLQATSRKVVAAGHQSPRVLGASRAVCDSVLSWLYGLPLPGKGPSVMGERTGATIPAGPLREEAAWSLAWSGRCLEFGSCTERES